MFRFSINPPKGPIDGFLNHLKSLDSSTNFNTVMGGQTMDYVSSLHENTGYRSKDWNHHYLHAAVILQDFEAVKWLVLERKVNVNAPARRTHPSYTTINTPLDYSLALTTVQSQLRTTERNDMTDAQKQIYCLLKVFGATLSNPGYLESFPKAEAAGLFNTPSFKQYHEEALLLKAGSSVTTSMTSTSTNSINVLFGGETRLHIAVRNKSLASVKEIVENRAFTAIETRDNQGKTALDNMYAAIQGKAASSVAPDLKEIIITLLRHGAVATSEQYNAFAALGIDAAQANRAFQHRLGQTVQGLDARGNAIEQEQVAIRRDLTALTATSSHQLSLVEQGMTAIAGASAEDYRHAKETIAVLVRAVQTLALDNQELRLRLGAVEQQLLLEPALADNAQLRLSSNPHSFMRSIEGPASTPSTNSQVHEPRLNT